MKKSIKIHIVLILLICTIIFAAGCEKKEEVKEERVYLPKVTTFEAKPGLQQEFTVTGEVFAHQISRMTADMRGKVESISVKEGDQVSKGQKLIALSSVEVDSVFNTASSTLRNAQVGLESTQLSLQESIHAAEIALETAQLNLANTLSQNKTLKKQAEETLEATKLSVGLSVSSVQNSLDNVITNSFTPAQSAFNDCNRILGLTGVYKFTNERFRENLGVLDNRHKKQTENAVLELHNSLLTYSESYDNAMMLLLETEDVLRQTLRVLHNSVTGVHSYYTQAALTADINIINGHLNSIRNSISGLESAQKALESSRQESNGKSQSVVNAEAAYQTTLTQLEVNERNARQAVESSENALANSKRSADLSRLSSKSSVDSAYGVYDQARISKDKLTIKAPFTGKVSEIHVKKGEEINISTPLVTVEDDSQLNLLAYLSSRDVKKIKVGDVVMINKDNLSLVTSIAPSADSLTKKYKVEIKYENTGLKPGELVRLTFITGEGFQNDRLFIPLPTLHILPDELFVWKVEDGKTVKAVVEVDGIEGDFVEVLSGIKTGDEIIDDGGRLIEEEGVEVEIVN